MRRAYNRGGFAIAALYGIFSLASGLFLGLFAGIGIGLRIVNNIDIFEIIAGSGALSIFEIMDYLYDPSIVWFIMAGMVLGSMVGMLIGIPVMKKILPRENPKPIEKRSLSAGEFLKIALMAFGLWGTGVLIGNFPAFLGYDIANPLLENSGNALILYLVYAIFGAPVFEELVFRKLLLNALHPYGSVPAAFTSALLFGLMHGNAAQFLLAFTLGLLLATVYQKTGKVIYTICLHLMINFFATIPDIVLLFGPDISTAWYIAFGVLVAAGLVVILLMRKHELLKLDRPIVPDANRQAFKNPGMLITVIGGTVLVAVYEIYMLVIYLLQVQDPGVLLRLIPLVISIVVVILVTSLVGRHTDPAPEVLLPEEEIPLQTVEAPVLSADAPSVTPDVSAMTVSAPLMTPDAPAETENITE